MDINFILPVSIVLGLLSFSLIAKWYVMPLLAPLSRSEALTPLLLLHSFRYVGIAFLIPGVTSEILDPRFANPAAYGDLLAAVLALIAMTALRLRWAMAIPLVWIFNIERIAGIPECFVSRFPSHPRRSPRSYLFHPCSHSFGFIGDPLHGFCLTFAVGEEYLNRRID